MGHKPHRRLTAKIPLSFTNKKNVFKRGFHLKCMLIFAGVDPFFGLLSGCMAAIIRCHKSLKFEVVERYHIELILKFTWFYN